MAGKIIPVIMCGGAGTRLWPVSREITGILLYNIDGNGSCGLSPDAAIAAVAPLVATCTLPTHS